MIDILSHEGRDVVQRVARDRALLAFDFDGTLAPIVEDRRDARLSDHTRALLRAAALLFPCAVISGRARVDLATRLARVPLAALVGNHGAEMRDAPPPSIVRKRVGAWAAALREAIERDGVEVEDKGFTVAVHYRRSQVPAEARRRIEYLASILPGARVFGGHMVVNIAPIGLPTKADAVEGFAAQFTPAPLLFVGDDRTDEDAFRSPVVTYSVRVGRAERTAARFYVEDQRAIDRLLWALIAERAREANLGGGWQEVDSARKDGGRT